MNDDDILLAEPNMPTVEGGWSGEKNLADPFWRKYVRDMALYKATIDPEERALGGSLRKVSRKEARERALDRLVPRSIQILEDQMEGMSACEHCGRTVDEKVRQTAAIKLLEYGLGKPNQKVEQKVETRIVYETIGYRPNSNGN